MTGKQPPLPLTDENQRLVNLRLLRMVQSFKPKGMEGLFAALDFSLKQEGEEDLLTYDGMRRAVNRDIKKLSNLAGKQKELRRWLKTRKNSGKLQIRITKHQFLLNNILSLLGLQFEDLFDKDKLPGEADETSDACDVSIKDDDDRETRKILQEINSKLDKVIFQQKRDKIRKPYSQRFNDLYFYLLLVKNTMIELCDNPEQNGFAFKKQGDNKEQRTPQEIYNSDFSFLFVSLQNIHGKSKIKKLFSDLHKNANNNFGIGRLISPLFMIGILAQLFIYFIICGNRTGKQIFQIMEGNAMDFLKRHDSDNDEVLDKLEKVNNKTIGLIKHILSTEINISDELCAEYEILFVRFFYNTDKLFEKQVPIWNNMFNIPNRKEMENRIIENFTLGYLFSFHIKREQLDYLDTFVKDAEQAQFDLENNYVGNVETAGTRTDRKQIASLVGLPEGSG
jgi:hypothetical protein